MMKFYSKALYISLLLLTAAFQGFSQQGTTPASTPAAEKAKPVFKDGEAQIVPAFDTPDKWIRHDLWVETTFDTDGDGKPDRMHVSVTRPYQTETEGIKTARDL